MTERDERVLETLRKIVKDNRCPKAERDAAQGRMAAIYSKYGKETQQEESQRTRTQTKNPYDDIFGSAYTNSTRYEDSWDDILRNIFNNAARSQGFGSQHQGFNQQTRRASYQSEEEKRERYRNAYDQRRREEENARQREKQKYRTDFEDGRRWVWKFGKDPEPVAAATPLKVDFTEPTCTDSQYSYIKGICRAFGFKIPPRNVSFRNANDFLNIWSPRYKDVKWHRMYREIYDDADFKRYYDSDYGPNDTPEEDATSHAEQVKRSQYYMDLFKQGVISVEEMETLLKELKTRR